jgi:hypothetical protein
LHFRHFSTAWTMFWLLNGDNKYKIRHGGKEAMLATGTLPY